ncbi:hypothetical protein V1511DRAFT_494239 [Dipodascopsis uninucleata]
MCCPTDCFTAHLYKEFFKYENLGNAEGPAVPYKRYLQYAAVWRRIAEDIDSEGPHTAEEWWAIAELKFKILKARVRYSTDDEVER